MHTEEWNDYSVYTYSGTYLANNIWERMWKEVAVCQFKVPSYRTEEKREKWIDGDYRDSNRFPSDCT